MKHEQELASLLQAYARQVTRGPHGLLSTNDLARIDDHVCDALTGLEELAGALSIVDVGTGGGLPGIPLALAIPESQVHLVESVGWKTTFLAECVTALHIAARVAVHTARAEDIVGEIGRETLDAAVARAVATPAVIAEYLTPFVRVGGKLLAWSTTTLAADIRELGSLDQLGLDTPRVVSASSPLRADGVLIAWDKVAPAAERFPRRAGVAKRKPLR